MSDLAVRVENLGKIYRIGESRGQYPTKLNEGGENTPAKVIHFEIRIE
jgi:hypothetical protein